MSLQEPRVSIGLPVYNGEAYLEQAIDSLLAQSFSDFEFIISDNASTDRTEQICRSYEARDKRVRYSRAEKNVGVNPNFRRAFGLARGEYFKWAAHDDLHTPDFLEKCVAVLDRDPSVILCYTRALVVDQHGKAIKSRTYGLQTDLPRLCQPQERFRDVLWINLGSPPIYGLFRTDILRKTHLLGNTCAADQVLLAEAALYGRFHEVHEELLLHREHPHRSVYDQPTRHALTVWVEPALGHGVIFPAWRILRDYLSVIRRSPLRMSQRVQCRLHVLRWARDHVGELLGDLTMAARTFSSFSKHGHGQEVS